MNTSIVKAAFCEETETVPVWVMRQAGRYLPEFRKIREDHEFFEICQTPELACEVTLQPIKRFDLDAAIIFSDILVIPQALGMEVIMEPGKGPTFPNPLSAPEDMSRLDQGCNVAERLSYVSDAIHLTVDKLNGKVPLVGFAGSPWTLMTYMIEGAGSSTYSKTKKWLYSNPTASHNLLKLLTEKVSDFLAAQVKAGCQMLQVFDSHAGFLDRKMFCEFSLKYAADVANMTRDKLMDNEIDPVPMVLFPRGAGHALVDIANLSHYDVIGLDWTIDPSKARKIIKKADRRIALQGNLDPCALYSSKQDLQRRVEEMLTAFGPSKGVIANLGHGVYPDTDPEMVKIFVDTVHDVSRKMKQEKGQYKLIIT